MVDIKTNFFQCSRYSRLITVIVNHMSDKAYDFVQFLSNSLVLNMEK